MSQPLGFLLIVLLPVFAGTLGVAQSVPIRSVTMQDLTVPTDRLPDGCRLKVIEPLRHEVLTSANGVRTISSTGSHSAIQPGGTLNPWTGTDRRVLAKLRQRVDGYGAVRLPDAPPPTIDEQSAIRLQFADGVAEGYAATYAQTAGRDIEVLAVRFSTAPAPERHHNFGHRNEARVFDIGLIRATLFGDDRACATAIGTHLKSVGK